MSDTSTTPKAISRRGFLGASLAAVPAIGFGAGPDRAPSAQTSAPAAGKPRIREYRRLGRTEFNVSDVSFGAGGLSNVDVFSAAVEAGINYIDTGEHYENGGSERTIGEALKRHDRKSLFITTKLNLTFNKQNDLQGIRDRFEKCLERLKTDHVDCLMIHMCTLAQVKHEPYHEAIRELKANGRVRFSGLSNHGADLSLYGRLDDPMESVLLAAAEDGRFDVVLFVHNYLKTETGRKILDACKAKDMGTTLMKMDPAFYIKEDRNILAQVRERYKSQGKELPPVFGTLERQSQERAEKTQAFLDKHGLSGPEQTRAAAIRFCLSDPGVDCVCPSIYTFQDLEAFVALSGGKTSPGEKAMLADYAGAAGDFYCRHACGICEADCPRGVPVNTIMRYEYYFRAKRQEKMAMREYAALGNLDASACAECDAPCVRACPHGVPIQGKLALAHQTLSMP